MYIASTADELLESLFVEIFCKSVYNFHLEATMLATLDF